MQRLLTKDLTIGYGDTTIVNNLNVEIPDGKITALVGANGSGKSTILKTMARLMKPKKGGVLLDGEQIHTKSTKEVAKSLAILPQNPSAPDGLTVYELVGYGRYPHQKGMGAMSAEDKKIIEWSLEVTGMSDFYERGVDQLSGGQRQRAWIAMALAQQTDILFLDEPTTFLDMAHQLDVLQLLKQLNEQENRTIIMVVHDISHATRFAHNMIAIKQGTVVSSGTPTEVVTADVLQEVFNIKADIITDPQTGGPYCIPYGLIKST